MWMIEVMSLSCEPSVLGGMYKLPTIARTEQHSSLFSCGWASRPSTLTFDEEVRAIILQS